MKKTYHGSCHCKAVTFEADLDLSQGTRKCNCTFCWKQRMWVADVTEAEFRLLSGADALADFGKSGDWGEGHHRFCSHCGIATHSHGEIKMMGGPFFNLNVNTLDDLSTEELLAAPVTYQDGLHDNWQNRPAETRQL